jgi:hypothetical protein
MCPLTVEEFGASLAASFQVLSQFKNGFQDSHFKSCDEAAIQLSMFWDPRFLPNFQLENDKIKSPQEEWFTVFAFAETLSEVLIGIEELAAYEVLERKDYDQFANFTSYTSCFHLVDSFLCSSGLYWIPNPVGGCEWKQLRRITAPPAQGAPVSQLEPYAFKFQGRNPSILARTTNKDWVFEPKDPRPVHVSRWRVFGEELQRLLKQDGLESVPKRVRRFFGLFSGHLAFRGNSTCETKTVPGLRRLIRVACLDKDALVPRLRNLAVYDNRSLDEHLRLVSHMLDQTIVDSPTKLAAQHFNQLGKGLAEWQVERLKRVLSAVEKKLGPKECLEGVKSAFLFSGLVELDFSKVVDSDFYDELHRSIRDVIAPVFRNRRFIPLPMKMRSWYVGSLKQPRFHVMRLPITIPDIITVRDHWFPKSMLGIGKRVA